MCDNVAAPLPARGRLSKTTPISTDEKTVEPAEENSNNNKYNCFFFFFSFFFLSLHFWFQFYHNQAEGTTKWPCWNQNNDTKPEETSKATTTTTKEEETARAMHQIYTKLLSTEVHMKTLAITLQV